MVPAPIDRSAAPLPRCPRGHALTEANSYVDPRSLVRLCLTCTRQGQQLLLDPDGEACALCGFSLGVHRRGSFDHTFRSQ